MISMKLILAGSTLIIAATASASLLDKRIFEPAAMPQRVQWGSVERPEELSVTTEDGLVLAGYRWKARCAGHVTMVFFHGNSGNRHEAALLAAPLRRDDVELIVASYRGYGDNPGKPSEEGLYRDAAAFMAAAATSDPDKTFVFGFSLGGAVAAHAAERFDADALITLGTFTDMPSAAPRLVRSLIPYRFDTHALASEISAPWLILHGSEDEVVSINHAEKLAEAAGDNATLVRLMGAPHNIELDQIAERLWKQLGALVYKSEVPDLTVSGGIEDRAVYVKANPFEVAATCSIPTETEPMP